MVPRQAILFPENTFVDVMDSSKGTRRYLVETTLPLPEATTLVREGMAAQGFVQEGEATSEGALLFQRDISLLQVTIEAGTGEERSVLIVFAPRPTPEP